MDTQKLLLKRWDKNVAGTITKEDLLEYRAEVVGHLDGSRMSEFNSA
ncbi:hypothetical protein [Pseudodesulfovibrio portus]|nr:hypothetical protein [Pseudodesulfovibrio portus]